MKKKNYIIFGIILVIIILIIGIVIFFSNRKVQNIECEDLENNNTTNNSEYVSKNQEEINNIKNEINATGSTDIYQIEEEYDGRKILQIKPDVQFEVDLAGIMKKAKPNENELNELLAQVPDGKGIWVSKQSRERFSKLLRNNNIEKFNISNEGYLQIENSTTATTREISNKIKDMTNSNKLYIINMTGIAYQRDYISGEIEEYPFEDMDPYQILEPYQKENKVILEITTNKTERLNESEILDAITYY